METLDCCQLSGDGCSCQAEAGEMLNKSLEIGSVRFGPVEKFEVLRQVAAIGSDGVGRQASLRPENGQIFGNVGTEDCQCYPAVASASRAGT